MTTVAERKRLSDRRHCSSMPCPDRPEGRDWSRPSGVGLDERGWCQGGHRAVTSRVRQRHFLGMAIVLL